MVTKEKKEGDDTCCSEDMQAVCLISSRWSGGCAMTNTGLTNALRRQGRCCYCMLKKLAEQRALTESRTFLFAIVVFFTNVQRMHSRYAQSSHNTWLHFYEATEATEESSGTRQRKAHVWTEITICCHLATKTAEDSRGHVLLNS